MPLSEGVSDPKRYPLQVPWGGRCDGFIFQQTSLGVYVTDHQGKTLYVNDSYVRISGVPREELVGRRVDELVREGYFDHSATLLVLESMRSEKIRQRIRNKVSVTATGNPVLDGDGFLHYVITLVQPRKGDSVEGRDAQKTFICESPLMKEVLADAEKAAAFDIPVLILGATGTGKEVLSQWIHERSRRADGPFIRVNCAALSTTCLMPNCSAMVREVLPERRDREKRDCWKLHQRAPCSWMKLGICRSRPRPNCFAPWKTSGFAASVRPRSGKSISVSFAPRIRICPLWSSRDNFERTCSIASTASASTFPT